MYCSLTDGDSRQASEYQSSIQKTTETDSPRAKDTGPKGPTDSSIARNVVRLMLQNIHLLGRHLRQHIEDAEPRPSGS